MQTKEDFFNLIYNYYAEKAAERIPIEFLRELSRRITDYYFEQYSRFRECYPKSIKRYSTFKIEDLDHDTIFAMVVRYFKEMFGENYPDYSTKVLGISLNELAEHEKRWEHYVNK